MLALVQGRLHMRLELAGPIPGQGSLELYTSLDYIDLGRNRTSAGDLK